MPLYLFTYAAALLLLAITYAIYARCCDYVSFSFFTGYIKDSVAVQLKALLLLHAVAAR